MMIIIVILEFVNCVTDNCLGKDLQSTASRIIQNIAPNASTKNRRISINSSLIKEKGHWPFVRSVFRRENALKNVKNVKPIIV